MKKSINVIILIISAFILVACATANGTALVTGTQRTATNPESVVIYTEAPENYEVIGIVTASSDSGWTEQESLDYAMAELKKQAAKIGANAVLLESVGTSSSGGVISYGIYIPITAQNVSGKAIFVFDKQ